MSSTIVSVSLKPPTYPTPPLCIISFQTAAKQEGEKVITELSDRLSVLTSGHKQCSFRHDYATTTHEHEIILNGNESSLPLTNRKIYQTTKTLLQKFSQEFSHIRVLFAP